MQLVNRALEKEKLVQAKGVRRVRRDITENHRDLLRVHSAQLVRERKILVRLGSASVTIAGRGEPAAQCTLVRMLLVTRMQMTAVEQENGPTSITLR